MLVVLVVHVLVGMDQRLVDMLVLMALGYVQPDADTHQGGGKPEARPGVLAQEKSGRARRRRTARPEK